MDNVIQNTKLIANFFENLKVTFSLKKTLAVDSADFSAIEIKNLFDRVISGSPNQTIEQIRKSPVKYNLIFESLPFGFSILDWKDQNDKNHKLPTEYVYILESLKKLEENGLLVAILSQSVLFTDNGKKFERILNSAGYCFDAAFNLPESFYEPHTSLRPIALVIRKLIENNIFIAEVEYSSDLEKTLKNYFKKTSTVIEGGVITPRADFVSFEAYKINQQINNLQTQYKNYNEFRLEEIAKKINTTTQQFNDVDNCIYIPKIGTTRPISRLKNATMKHQNYFQVVLKSEIVNSRYVEQFFKSQLGILILGTLKKNTCIPHVNKSDLFAAMVPVPDLETQDLILQTSARIDQLKQEINNFESQLSLNPDSANKIRSILNGTLQSLGKLNEEDQIIELIRQGESKQLEFKQTFSKDAAMNIKEKEDSIRESSLKNIVAFLNSDGGTLLIGVKDSGEIFGIENDYYVNDDKYLLTFKNHIKDHIGENAYPFVDWKIITVGNKKILRVDCRKSISDPFFLDEKDFYVRTNPSADKLVGPKFLTYLKDRFNK